MPKIQNCMVSKPLCFYFSGAIQAHFDIVIICKMIESTRSIIHSWGLGHFKQGKSIVRFSVCIMWSIFIFNANIIFLWGDYFYEVHFQFRILFMLYRFSFWDERMLIPQGNIGHFWGSFFISFFSISSLLSFLSFLTNKLFTGNIMGMLSCTTIFRQTFLVILINLIWLWCQC